MATKTKLLNLGTLNPKLLNSPFNELITHGIKKPPSIDCTLETPFEISFGCKAIGIHSGGTEMGVSIGSMATSDTVSETGIQTPDMTEVGKFTLDTSSTQ